LGSDGAMVKVREIVAADLDRYFYADQYRNPANPLAHYRTTGPEIWEQTGGRVTHFVAGLGTSGTVVGTARYLHERNPRVRVVAVEPDHGMHGLEGLKHMASAIVPEIYGPRALRLSLRGVWRAARAQRRRRAPSRPRRARREPRAGLPARPLRDRPRGPGAHPARGSRRGARDPRLLPQPPRPSGPAVGDGPSHRRRGPLGRRR